MDAVDAVVAHLLEPLYLIRNCACFVGKVRDGWELPVSFAEIRHLDLQGCWQLRLHGIRPALRVDQAMAWSSMTSICVHAIVISPIC